MHSAMIRGAVLALICCTSPALAQAGEAFIGQAAIQNVTALLNPVRNEKLLATPVAPATLPAMPASLPTTSAGNNAWVFQSGAYNNATVQQIGARNSSFVMQQGQGNVAIVSQTGRTK